VRTNHVFDTRRARPVLSRPETGVLATHTRLARAGGTRPQPARRVDERMLKDNRAQPEATLNEYLMNKPFWRE